MIFDDLTFLRYSLFDLEELEGYINRERREQNRSLDFQSALMLSADNLKHLNKIDELEADCIVINLEDGVAIEKKPLALRLAAIFISHLQKSDKKIVVRVNALDEGAYEEIALLNSIYPDAIRVPKIRTKEDVKLALKLIDKKIEVHLSIETKEAWLHLKELQVNKRVKVFYLGILDLFADLQLEQSLLRPSNPMLQHILSEFLLTSSALGVKAVSFVYQNYKNESEFKEYLHLEKSLGFQAKACISPSQVTIVKSAFAPSSDTFTRAQAIVSLFEANRKRAITGFTHEKYGFIDEPIYKDALNILKRY